MEKTMKSIKLLSVVSILLLGSSLSILKMPVAEAGALSGTFCRAANLNQALQGMGWSQRGVQNNSSTSFFVVCGLTGDFDSTNVNPITNDIEVVGTFPGSTGQIECTLRTQDLATGTFTSSSFNIASTATNRGTATANTVASSPSPNTTFVCALNPGEGIEGYWGTTTF